MAATLPRKREVPPFARLRRARDPHGQMVATRFARLRRARDPHAVTWL